MKKLDREQFIRDAIALAEARVRFLHQGRSPETGLDCINTPRYLLEKQGLLVPFEFGNYHTRPDAQKLFRCMSEWLTIIDESAARAGDLYMFRHGHVGVRVSDDEPPMMVHALSFPEERIVHVPLDATRSLTLRAVFRLPDEFQEGEGIA